MRFAAIADVHGNHLALEAVLADIRAEGISEIANLGDMASGPLEARRAMDALMALDAVHVLGNHDRWLIDRPVEKMGSWERPAHAQLGIAHFDWLRTVPATQVFRDQVFLCHATPADDNVYWLETVTPDGSVRMSSLEAIEKEAEGISQSLILCAHTHIARAVRLGDGRLVVNPGSVGLPAYTDGEPIAHSMQMGAPHARYAVVERKKATDPWRITFRVVAYDWEGAAARAKSKGREDWAHALRTGYAS